MNNQNNKKINWKSLGTIAIIVILVLSIIGIVFLSLSFVDKSKNKQSKDFGDQLSLKYSVIQNKDATNKNLNDTSDAFYQIVKNHNISEFKIDYSLIRTNILTNKNDLNNNLSYLNFYLTTNVNDPFFGFDSNKAWSLIQNHNQEDIPLDFDYVGSLKQQINLFSKLNNNYNLRFASSKVNLNPNLDLTKPNIKIAEKDSNVKVGSNIDISLPESKLVLTPIDKNDKENYWDLSYFQKEFVNNFQIEWDSITTSVPTNQQIIDKFKENNPDNTNSKLKDPINVDLIWVNRSKLIFDLQISYIAVYLSDLLSTGTINNPVDIKLAKNLISTLTAYERDIGYWLFKNRNIKNASGQTYLEQLATSLSYESTNNLDWKHDPLILLLNQYYELRSPSVPVNDPDYDTIKTYKETNFNASINSNIPKFLYSWNLETNELISKNLLSIDYYNFFNFFPESNNAFLPKDLQEENKPDDNTTFITDKKKWTQDHYYSKNISINSSNLYSSGYSDIGLDKLLKDYSIENNFFSPNILEATLLKTNKQKTTDSSEVFNLTQNFLNQYTIIKTEKSNSIIGLPNYLSTFIGIIVLILIVGIVVSILYRIPGFISFILSLFTFVASSAFFVSLGTPFSFNTFLSLSVFSLLSFIPNIMLFDYFKIGIRKKLNSQNSMLYSFKKYLRISLGYHLAAIFIGISFLFFGKYELVGFGSILVVSAFTSILINSILFFLMFLLFLYCSEMKPNLFLNNKYIKLLEELNKTTFQDTTNYSLIEPVLFSNKTSQSIAKLSFFSSIKKNWILIIFIILTIIAIIGSILLGVLGFGFSSDFNKTSSIFIVVPETISLSNSDLHEIASFFGSSVEKIDINDSSLNHKYLITLKQDLSNIDFQTLLNTSSFKELLIKLNLTNLNMDANNGFDNMNQIVRNIQLVFNNIMPSIALRNGLISCIFIAIAFLMIWSLIWLGFSNMIMYFILILFNMLLIIGVVGITRISFNIDSLMSSAQTFLFFALLNFIVFSDYKQQISIKDIHEIEDIKQKLINQNERILTIYFATSLSFVAMNILSIVVLNEVFAFPIIITVISSLIISITNFVVINNLFYVALLFKRLFAKYKSEKAIKKYLSNQGQHKRQPKDFDKIDEQEILGINKFAK